MIISLKGAFVASVVAAFIAGALNASPELRAYAAATIGSADIINNSIQSVDIKDGEVKSAEIGAGAVQNGDIANNAVTSAKVKDGLLTADDMAPGVVSGPTTLSIRQVEFSVPFTTNTMSGAYAQCEESEQAIGGGFRIDGGSATYGRITQADLLDNGYYVSGFNDHEWMTGTLTAIAYCGVMDLK